MGMKINYRLRELPDRYVDSTLIISGLARKIDNPRLREIPSLEEGRVLRRLPEGKE